MLEFARTTDLELVRLILTQDTVWPHVTDDFCERRGFQPNNDPRIWYVLAIEDSRVIGLFSFLPRSTVRWEVHLILERERKTKGTAILSAGLKWMFEHSTAERIIAEIPASNRLAVKLAERVMDQAGIDRKSFHKHGVLQDLILFGLSKKQEVTCLQS